MADGIIAVLVDVPVQIGEPRLSPAEPTVCKSTLPARGLVIRLPLQVFFIGFRCSTEKSRGLIRSSHIEKKIGSIGSQPPSLGQENQRSFTVALCCMYSAQIENRLYVI